ncbi:hypothetical protein DK867_04755 [Ochrobactrum sp. POC9]|nr:hypothetical protein DK867_04755 [Ochrobactrum sp. POC9]
MFWRPENRYGAANCAPNTSFSIERFLSSEAWEMLYPFVFTHYPTQNRFALLLEMRIQSSNPTSNKNFGRQEKYKVYI